MTYTLKEIEEMKPKHFLGKKIIMPQVLFKGRNGKVKYQTMTFTWMEEESTRIVASLQNIASKLKEYGFKW